MSNLSFTTIALALCIVVLLAISWFAARNARKRGSKPHTQHLARDQAHKDRHKAANDSASAKSAPAEKHPH